MFLLDENISFLRFKHNTKEAMDDLTDDLVEMKEEIMETDPEEFYSKNKRYFKVVKDLLFNWIKYGLIMGPALIPFSLTMSLINILVKRSLKHAKNEMEEKMIIEYAKIYIRYLTQIKSNNNNKVADKVDKMIDGLNNAIDATLDD